MSNDTSEKPVFLEGKTTILRPLSRDDLPEITRFINDQEIAQWVRAYRPMMMEDEERWIDRLVGNESGFVLAIETKEDRQFIGTMGVHNIDHRQGHCSTGAIIGSKAHHGKGFGSDAKMHLLHYVFTELNMRKVTSTVLAPNKRSRAYLKKTGYVEIGTRRAHVLHKGVFVDEVLVEVFREDFVSLWDDYNKTT